MANAHYSSHNKAQVFRSYNNHTNKHQHRHRQRRFAVTDGDGDGVKSF